MVCLSVTLNTKKVPRGILWVANRKINPESARTNLRVNLKSKSRFDPIAHIHLELGLLLPDRLPPRRTPAREPQRPFQNALGYILRTARDCICVRKIQLQHGPTKRRTPRNATSAQSVSHLLNRQRCEYPAPLLRACDGDVEPPLSAVLVNGPQKSATESPIFSVTIRSREQHHIPLIALNSLQVLDKESNILPVFFSRALLFVCRHEAGISS